MSESEEFISALERTVELLRNSHNGNPEWIREVTFQVEAHLDHYRKNGKFAFLGKSKLRRLFLPSIDLDKSEIEEIADDNGWTDEYLEISEIADNYLNWFPTIF